MNPPPDRACPAAATAPARPPDHRSVAWLGLLYGLVAVGMASRIAPLFDHGGRLLRQFPTEDGYLSLQIARNMALGAGMSVSAGTIPTNGTQPFCTWLWSLAYRLVDADKTLGVLAVLVLQVLVAIAAAAMLFVVGRRLLADFHRGCDVAALAACAWFASPVVVPHSMNCLESGTYALAVLVVLWVLLRAEEAQRWSVARCLTIGAVLGWVFWVRNDAVFLILAVCLTRWLLPVARREQPILGRSLGEATLVGATTVLVAAPWLHYNVTTFGHLVPISGIAESHGARFGQNLHLVPIKLFESFSVLAPIPHAFESGRWVSLACAGMVAIAVAGCVRVLAARRQLGRAVWWVFGSYALLLAGYYGVAFGAAHFMGRYLFPLSGILALAWAALVLEAWNRIVPLRGGRMLAGLAACVLGVVAGATNLRLYLQGDRHMHFQVVSWVQQNVSDQTWIGAIQSGTLGYFHDRTYNLDGKVNPEALQAKLRGEIPRYVVDQGIEVLADWIGIATWAELPLVREHFDVVVEDPRRNLAVLVRRCPPRCAHEPER